MIMFTFTAIIVPFLVQCSWRQDSIYRYGQFSPSRLNKAKIQKDTKFEGIVNKETYIYWYFLCYMLDKALAENIWDKVFKHGPSKICDRQHLKNFTWPVFEYFVSFYFIAFQINFNEFYWPFNVFYFIDIWFPYRRVYINRGPWFRSVEENGFCFPDFQRFFKGSSKQIWRGNYSRVLLQGIIHLARRQNICYPLIRISTRYTHVRVRG